MEEKGEALPLALQPHQVDIRNLTPTARREFIKTLTFASASLLITHVAYSALREFSEVDKLALEERKALVEKLGLSDLNNEKFSLYSSSEPIELHGRQFEMIGVAHSPQTLYFHHQEIEEKVRQAPFVFLEYFGRPHQQLALPNVPFERILAPEHFYWSFYAGVGKICAEQGKDVLVVNPQNKPTELLEAYLAVGIPVGLTAIGVEEASELFANALKKHLSRREFLKGLVTQTPKWALMKSLALGPSASVWAGWSGLTEEMKSTLTREGIISSDLPPEQQANLLAWYMQDWRNVQTAQGVDKAMSLFAGEIASTQTAPMFQGDKHKAMIEYLKDSSLRRKKIVAYPHYRALGETTIRRYSYDPGKNCWELTQRIRY